MREEVREIKENFRHRRSSPSRKLTDNVEAAERRKSDKDDDRIEERQESTSRRSSSLAT